MPVRLKLQHPLDNMKPLYYIVFFFFLVNLYSQDQLKYHIGSIDFHHLEIFSQKEACDLSGLKIGNVINTDELYSKSYSFLSRLEQKGYVYSSIDSIIFSTSNDSIYIDLFFSKIQKGVIDSVIVQGPDIKNIEPFFNPIHNIDIQNFRLDPYIENAILYYEKKGRPFASIRLDSILVDSTIDAFHYTMFLKNIPGPELYIDKINITGNEFTKDKVILREIRINRGDIYNFQKVKSIRSRLMRLGYFKEVYPPDVYIGNKNKGGLSIHVKEGKTSKFDGVVGYTPASEFEKGYFTGLVDIEMGNLFGTGRSLKIHWQKRNQNSQDLEIYYREPWIAGFPVHIGAGFTQLIQDTTYIERHFLADFELPLSQSFSIVSTLSRNMVIPDSVGSYVLGIPKSRSLSASIGLKYDSRDNLVNPKQGLYYFTNIENGQKKNIGPDSILSLYSLKKNITNRKIKIDFESFFNIFSNQVISLSFHGRIITSNESEISLPDQFRLGGTRSLRGYREDQFRGSSIAWSNLEYRYLFGPLSRAFIFFDSGYYSQSFEQTGIYKMGYGFGVRLETGLGIMGIDYGLAIGEKTEGVLGGMIHVGLINTF